MIQQAPPRTGELEVYRIADLVRAGWSKTELLSEGHDEHLVDEVLRIRDEVLEQERLAPLREARASREQNGEPMDPQREAQADARNRWIARKYKDTDVPRTEWQTAFRLSRKPGAPAIDGIRYRARQEGEKWAHYEEISTEHLRVDVPDSVQWLYRIAPGTGFGPYGEESEVVKQATPEIQHEDENITSPNQWQTISMILKHPGAPASDNSIRRRAASKAPRWKHYEIKNIEGEMGYWPPNTKHLYRLKPGTTFEPLQAKVTPKKSKATKPVEVRLDVPPEHEDPEVLDLRVENAGLKESLHEWRRQAAKGYNKEKELLAKIKKLEETIKELEEDNEGMCISYGLMKDQLHDSSARLDFLEKDERKAHLYLEYFGFDRDGTSVSDKLEQLVERQDVRHIGEQGARADVLEWIEAADAWVKHGDEAPLLRMLYIASRQTAVAG